MKYLNNWKEFWRSPKDWSVLYFTLH